MAQNLGQTTHDFIRNDCGNGVQSVRIVCENSWRNNNSCRGVEWLAMAPPFRAYVGHHCNSNDDLCKLWYQVLWPDWSHAYISNKPFAPQYPRGPPLLERNLILHLRNARRDRYFDVRMLPRHLCPPGEKQRQRTCHPLSSQPNISGRKNRDGQNSYQHIQPSCKSSHTAQRT